MRLAADENFHGDIVRGLRRQYPELDIVRVQDTPVYMEGDDRVLEWASQENRILLTHDKRTMPRYVRARIAAGKPVPGVFIVSDQISIGQAISELQLIIAVSEPTEWVNRVIYVPL